MTNTNPAAAVVPDDDDGPDDLALHLVALRGLPVGRAAYLAALAREGGQGGLCGVCLNAVAATAGKLDDHYRFADGIPPHARPAAHEVVRCEGSGVTWAPPAKQAELEFPLADAEVSEPASADNSS